MESALEKIKNLKKGGKKANKKLVKKKDDLKAGGKKANKTLEREKKPSKKLMDAIRKG